MPLSLSLLSALILDYCLGEPDNARHPLVIFGRYANRLEDIWSKPHLSAPAQKILGSLALLCALLPSLIGLPALWLPPALQVPFGIVVLYFCIGASSLRQHAHAVYQALNEQDLTLARRRVGLIVSRETERMDAVEVRRAAIESVLENGADAIFAPLFWFVVLGPIGALLYRFANTLDAMWGYKNPRYLHFGWAAARFDDLLNWLPARLTALGYAAIGNGRQAIHAWRHQAHLLDSPNAGPVMTAGAGALGLNLGGPAWYHGQLKQKPRFGGTHSPVDADIGRATTLVYRTLGLWLLLIAGGERLA